MRTFLVLALVLLPAAAAVQNPSLCASDAPGCVPFERLARGLSSGTWGPYVTIETQADWDAFWARHSGGPQPVVDFSTHWVAAIVFNHHKCCPVPEVRDVLFTGASYVVRYDYLELGLASAFSEPHDIVKVERQSDLPVVAVYVGPPTASPPHRLIDSLTPS